MARKVFDTQTHTVSGNIQMPNGLTDYGRLGLGATGPGWVATTEISANADGCSVNFYSGGPESTGGVSDPSIVRASVAVGAASASLDFAGTYAPGYESYSPSNGRGNFGDNISGTFSFSCTSDLVLYTYGEDVSDIPSPIPDDYYPHYGGVRIVGEFPSNYGLLIWEPHPESTVGGTVTFGDRSASVSAPSSTAYFSDAISFNVSLGQSPAGSSGSGDTVRPWGTLNASINLTGYPVGSGGASAYYEYSGGGGVAGGGEVGPGYAKAYMDTESEGVPSASVGGIAAGGVITPTRTAAVVLDAMAMDHTHPHECHWWVLEKYKGVEPPTGGAEYGEIIDPPSPLWFEHVGQSVSVSIVQKKSALVVTAFNKSVGAKHRTSGSPAHGYIGATYVTYDHYENQQGMVQAYIVPPPGENENDWRVGFRGKKTGGITIARESTHSITLPTGTADGSDNLYDFDDPNIWEGYRYMLTTGTASSFTVNGKSFPAAAMADLCFPNGGGPSIDRQDTRFPLDADRLSTIETPLWGITKVLNIRAIGGTLDSAQLDGNSISAKVHALAPFVDWVQEVPDDELETGGGDEYTVEHYCTRGIMADSSGRQALEIPHARKQVNNAPARLYSTDYFHLDCATMATLIAETPGWSASSVADMWGDSPPAWFVCQGYVLSAGTWTKQWERGTGTVDAQAVYDGMTWPGDVGDVFGTGSGGTHTIGLVGRKIFRGSAYGPTKEDTTVHYSDLTPGGTVYDQATTDKRYFVGPTLSDSDDWGSVWVMEDHKASFGGLPRRIERGAFSASTFVGIHLASAPWDGGILETRAVDGTARTKTFLLQSEELEGEVGSAQSAQGMIAHDGTYVVMRSADGTTTESRSWNQGVDWVDEAMTIPGDNPAPARKKDEQYTATWTDPGWDLYRKLPGETSFDFVIHIADAPKSQAGMIAEEGLDGRLIFSYFDGSTTKRLQSTNQGEDWEDYVA